MLTRFDEVRLTSHNWNSFEQFEQFWNYREYTLVVITDKGKSEWK